MILFIAPTATASVAPVDQDDFAVPSFTKYCRETSLHGWKYVQAASLSERLGMCLLSYRVVHTRALRLSLIYQVGWHCSYWPWPQPPFSSIWPSMISLVTLSRPIWTHYRRHTTISISRPSLFAT